MKKNLKDFYKNVKIENKNIAIYLDEEGTMKVLNPAQLIVGIDYLELTDEELKIAVFQGIVDDLEYFKIPGTRAVSKYSKTQKEEDKYIIIDEDVELNCVWNVSNQVQVSQGITVHSSFNNSKDALEFANKLNKDILNMYKD